MTLFDRFYDADYERKRNELIPKAVAKANRNFGSCCKQPGDRKALERFAAGWNKSYRGEMNRLAQEAGLLK